MNAEKFLRVNDRTVQSTLGGMIEDGLEFLRCNGLNGEPLAFAQEQHVFQSEPHRRQRGLPDRLYEDVIVVADYDISG